MCFMFSNGTHLTSYPWGKTESFSFKVRNKRGCLPLPPIFNIVLWVLGRASTQEKEIVIQTGRKEVKLFLFADDMILHVDSAKDTQSHAYIKPVRKTVQTNKKNGAVL